MDTLFAGGPSREVAAYFDVWVLKLSGLFPTPAECAGCGRPLGPEGPLLFDETRPGFVGAECRRGELLRLSPPAAETLRIFLSSALDPAVRHGGISEIAAVAQRARRHFLGHELKSQRVLTDVMG